MAACYTDALLDSSSSLETRIFPFRSVGFCEGYCIHLVFQNVMKVTQWDMGFDLDLYVILLLLLRSLSLSMREPW